ncbi:MAG: glycosyltransferase family 9 protein [Bacteroidetes bacterium]|nr:glycosyltransferase family 9 protein [Bacteroidota bacterium]
MNFYKPDCLFFKGDLPCKPHKESGYHCNNCPSYTPISKRILIIKLGAIGDVIRTTPLVTRYKTLYPNCKITWLTLTPAILPSGKIDEILKFDYASSIYLENASFDIAINLDKEKEACALLLKVNAKEKYGYVLKDNVAQPINDLANHKFHTGLFDDVSKANTQNYCQEIFEMCGMTYSGETYLLDNHNDKGYEWTSIDKSKTIIGLNTGCGDRWTTRLWPKEYFAELAQKLISQGFEVILLGGEQEDQRNKDIQALSGAKYLGFFSLSQFINLINQCTLIVTQVTMGMHLTLGMQKKIVLMNNIFNANEFDLFGKGEIVMPDKECLCFYRGQCVIGISCMADLPVNKVLESVNKLLTLN